MALAAKTKVQNQMRPPVKNKVSKKDVTRPRQLPTLAPGCLASNGNVVVLFPVGCANCKAVGFWWLATKQHYGFFDPGPFSYLNKPVYHPSKRPEARTQQTESTHIKSTRIIPHT